jgi:hypothetical protein
VCTLRSAWLCITKQSGEYTRVRRTHVHGAHGEEDNVPRVEVRRLPNATKSTHLSGFFVMARAM